MVKKKVKKQEGRFKYKDCPSGLNEKVFYRIKQLRLQMLIHSHMYYRLNTSILVDTEFDRRAYELRDLQKAYPEESKEVDMYEDFADWDGTTGFHLPYYPFVDAITKSILQIYEEKEKNK